MNHEHGVPPRKARIPVVLDTNVIVGFYLSRRRHSPQARVWRLWRDLRRVQLIVSHELVQEYLEVLRRLGVPEERIARFGTRLQRRNTVTLVNLGGRPQASRDPDDNLILATAMAGNAVAVVTNDRDLLDIPAAVRRRFRFRIVTPAAFLAGLRKR